jgi:hypothetical protein
LEVVHDGGTEFSNNGITELFAMCGMHNTKTLAYSKEENSMVERANKEVMRHLRNILFETTVTKNWEDHLGTIMKIMNHQKRGYNSPLQRAYCLETPYERMNSCSYPRRQ